MIISDLEHLEIVGEEIRIEGGVQLVSGASSAVSGLATDGRVFTNNSSSTSASQSPDVFFVGFPFSFPIVVGNFNSTSAFGSASGSTSPF
jgi:hypothetical protein